MSYPSGNCDNCDGNGNSLSAISSFRPNPSSLVSSTSGFDVGILIDFCFLCLLAPLISLIGFDSYLLNLLIFSSSLGILKKSSADSFRGDFMVVKDIILSLAELREWGRLFSLFCERPAIGLFIRKAA